MIARAAVNKALMAGDKLRVTTEASSLMTTTGSAPFFVTPGMPDAEAQDVYSDGSSPHKSAVSDDPDEVFGDSIDEDSQRVQLPTDGAADASTSGLRSAPSLLADSDQWQVTMQLCFTRCTPVSGDIWHV